MSVVATVVGQNAGGSSFTKITEDTSTNGTGALVADAAGAAGALSSPATLKASVIGTQTMRVQCEAAAQWVVRMNGWYNGTNFTHDAAASGTVSISFFTGAGGVANQGFLLRAGAAGATAAESIFARFFGDGTTYVPALYGTFGGVGTLSLGGSLSSGGEVLNTGRMCWKRGADVPSAAALTLGRDGNLFNITGTTAITSITTTNWQDGSHIMLRLASTIVLTNGASLKLSGASNITAAAGGTYVQLVLNGTTWEQCAPKVDL